jgi:hypothetical protein
MPDHNPEDDYFARIEREKTEKLRKQLQAENRKATAEERKAAHWLRCGKCGGQMDTQVFRGVEIEVCPDCGAVLLDPGELEALAGADQGGIFRDFASIFGGGRR